MTNIENEMSDKSEAVAGLWKSFLTLGFIGGVQLSDVQTVVAIFASGAAGIYALLNVYVLWRDKIKGKKE